MSLKAMFSSGLMRGIGIGFAFVNTLLISRWGGAAVLGQYALWRAMIGWTSSIGQFGFRNWLIKEAAQNNIGIVLLGKILLFVLGVATLAGPLFFWLVARKIASGPVGVASLSSVFLMTAYLMVARTCFISVNRGCNRVATAEASHILIGRATVFVSLGLLILLSVEITFLRVAAILTGSTLLSTLFPLAVIFRHKASDPTKEASKFPKLRDVIPFFGISLSNLFAQRIDMLILGLFVSPEAIGLYKIGDRISKALLTFHQSAKASLMGLLPHWTTEKMDRQDIRSQIRNAVRLSTGATAGAVLVLATWGHTLLSFVFGSEFAVAWPIMIVLCVARLISTSAGPVGQATMLNGLEKRANVIFWLAAVLNALTSLLLVSPLGVLGVACGTLISNIVFNTLLLYILLTKIDMNTTAFG